MLTPTVRVQTFPNNEVRAVFYYAKSKDPFLESAKKPRSVQRQNGASEPLDIISKLEPGELMDSPQDSLKPGWGGVSSVSGFSVNGRRKLLRCGAAMAAVCDRPQEVIFITCTIPGSTYDCKKAIANYSAYAVHRLKSWIAKRVDSKLDMYVWEFQKRGMLHLHYAVVCKNEDTRKYVIDNVKKAWTAIVNAIGRKANVDMWRKSKDYTHKNNQDVIKVDAQECYKSVANYLAKYVSKSQQQYENNHWKECKPSRYWGISRPLTALCREMSTDESVSLNNQRELEASYEECLSITSRLARCSYNYQVRHMGVRVITAYSNEGERSWLLNQIKIGGLTRVEQSSRYRSVESSLCLGIAHCLAASSKLRKFVDSYSRNGYALKAIATASSESLTKSEAEELIIDFSFFMFQVVKVGLPLTAQEQSLSVKVRGYYKQWWDSHGHTPSTSETVRRSQEQAEERRNSPLTTRNQKGNLVPSRPTTPRHYKQLNIYEQGEITGV